MSCLGYKGGIGTASRRSPTGHTVGALLLSNFGGRDRLTVDGVPVGRLLALEEDAERQHDGRSPPRPPAGSCIVVLITDAPLDGAACTRLARRAGLGLARTGSTGDHGSGEIFLALATGLRSDREKPAHENARQVSGVALDPLFAAAVEATEEAVLNSMLAAETVTGRDGNVSRRLPVDRVLELLSVAGRRD